MFSCEYTPCSSFDKLRKYYRQKVFERVVLMLGGTYFAVPVFLISLESEKVSLWASSTVLLFVTCGGWLYIAEAQLNRRRITNEMRRLGSDSVSISFGTDGFVLTSKGKECEMHWIEVESLKIERKVLTIWLRDRIVPIPTKILSKEQIRFLKNRTRRFL